MDTLAYWLGRLEPLIRAETKGEIIVIMCNRTGSEEEAVYAGTSCVLGIHLGEVKVYGILGRGEKELLVVDTNKRPQAKLISEPNSAASHASTAPTARSMDSVFSQESAKSNLSVNTNVTPTLSPNTGTTQFDFGFDKPDEPPKQEFKSPVSPAPATSPTAYFATPERSPAAGETFHEPLQSSIEQKSFSPPLPNSPTFNRPTSPKSRNASRSRTPAQQPALVSHDLAMEEQVTQQTIRVKSPPLPAAAAPERYQSSFTTNSLGPRSHHVVPRPKSACW